MSNDIKNLKKRLIYRSQYRGTKEMDKLIGNFVQSNIDKFDSLQLNELEKFLEVDDDTLYKFYNGFDNNILIDKSEIFNLFKEYKYKN